MADTDPYAILGVSSTATQVEIARAYRALAKRHHPDLTATPSPTMARINEAWHVLRDPGRRARWDREHAIVIAPHWADAPPSDRVRRRPPPPAPPAPPSRMDSGWMAAAVVVGAAALVAVAMIGVVAAFGPADDRRQFTAPEIHFAYPDSWVLTVGEEADTAGHRVIAHLTSFRTDAGERCLTFLEPCPWSGPRLPAGGASVLVTAWEGGEPPVPEPRGRPSIGGVPAAFELRSVSEDAVTAWWQLSPPGFPDQWIEIQADVRGGELEQTRLFGHVEALLNSIEFR